jgi:diacylglycerol kinase (ATP)
MAKRRDMPARKPPRIEGLAHVFAAAGYSVDGMRRLWQEAAFRHELVVFCAALGLLAVLQASLVEFAILICLFLAVVAVEALNTAIEVLVDHLAPDWQAFAKAAKDLGSLAVMCLLLTGGVFMVVLCANRFMGS